MYFAKWMVTVLTSLGVSLITLGAAGLLFESVANADAKGIASAILGWLFIVAAGGIATWINIRDKGG